MEIIISNSSGVPIYEQIKDQIKAKIITGELAANFMLPSIRLLAKDLHCSVITTKNAYEELEKEGFIKSVPAKGFYVARINQELAKEEQLTKMENLISEALKIAKIHQISIKEIKEMIDIINEENES